MAIHFIDPKATFIHIPKTGGSSFQNWIEKSSLNYKYFSRHGNIYQIDNLNDLGFVFTFVRNPFDRMVSMFEFSTSHAQRRLESFDHSKKQKKHILQNFKIDKELVRLKNKGFDYWLKAIYEKNTIFDHCDTRDGLQFPSKPGQWWTIYTNQHEWINQECNTIKLENIDKEFRKLQELFKFYLPLPITNTTNHLNYKTYYKSTSKKIIYDLFEEDLNRFNYDF